MPTNVNEARARTLGSQLAKFVRKYPGPRYSQAELANAKRILPRYFSGFLTNDNSEDPCPVKVYLASSLPQNLLTLLDALLPSLPSSGAMQPGRDTFQLYINVLAALWFVADDVLAEMDLKGDTAGGQLLWNALQQPRATGAPGTAGKPPYKVQLRKLKRSCGLCGLYVFLTGPWHPRLMTSFML